MIAGTLLLIAGILIAVFPHLLSMIVAAVLILFGLVLIMVSFEMRRSGDNGRTQIIRYIMRY